MTKVDVFVLKKSGEFLLLAGVGYFCEHYCINMQQYHMNDNYNHILLNNIYFANKKMTFCHILVFYNTFKCDFEAHFYKHE